MNINLSSPERLMILDAMMSEGYTAMINNPKTTTEVRDVYNGLVIRIQADERLHLELQGTVDPGGKK